MNFANLKGLTIPEGNVTQITDASGRVIWSANKTVNTLYLRPSADISIGHSLYPADSPSAYSLVNEEVNDHAATYIYSTYTDTFSGTEFTSIFALSHSKSVKSKGVTSGKLVYDYAMPSNVSSPTIYSILTISGEAQGEYFHQPSIIQQLIERELSATELEVINRYISQNGTIPTIILQVKTTGTKDSSKNNGTIRIGQIYLELNGEFTV